MQFNLLALAAAYCSYVFNIVFIAAGVSSPRINMLHTLTSETNNLDLHWTEMPTALFGGTTDYSAIQTELSSNFSDPFTLNGKSTPNLKSFILKQLNDNLIVAWNELKYFAIAAIVSSACTEVLLYYVSFINQAPRGGQDFLSESWPKANPFRSSLWSVHVAISQSIENDKPTQSLVSSSQILPVVRSEPTNGSLSTEIITVKSNESQVKAALVEQKWEISTWIFNPLSMENDILPQSPRNDILHSGPSEPAYALLLMEAITAKSNTKEFQSVIALIQQKWETLTLDINTLLLGLCLGLLIFIVSSLKAEIKSLKSLLNQKDIELINLKKELLAIKKGKSETCDAAILNLPVELFDHIKSFLPFSDQVRFFFCRKGKCGSRLIEGMEHVEKAFLKAVAENKAKGVEHLLKYSWRFRPPIDAIVLASKHGHVEVVKVLLADGRSDPSDNHNLAIAIASQMGHVDVVKLLLADGRSHPSDNDNLAIGFASTNGHVEIVKILLVDPRTDPHANANVSIRAASGYGHNEVVKILLADGRSDPSAANSEAIRAASGNGHVEIVRLLLTDGRSDPSAANSEAIRRASGNGHVEIVRLLLTDGRSDPSAAYSSAIFSASQNGHVEVVRLLLADGRSNPAEGNNIAIRFASHFGHVDVVRLLLADPRTDPSARLNDAIKLASFFGHAEIVRLLLTDARTDPSSMANIATRFASFNGHVEIVKILAADHRFLGNK